MKLLGLRFENFRSFAACELDLNADGLIAVVGPNGAGKSTIFAAVEWALYGGSRGRGANPVRRHGCPDKQPCFVELDFEIAGRSYTVRRVDGSDATLTALDTGEVLATTLSGVSRSAATTLGLTHEVFCGTFYARQREVQALDSAKASERRAQLERLLGIEQLRRATDLAARDAKEQKLVVDALAADAPDVAALKAELERVEREAQQAAPTVQQARKLLADLKAQRVAARERVDTLTAQESEAAKRRTAAEQAAGLLAGAELALEGLRAQIDAAETAEARLTALMPVAERADELAARERELDLRRENHERVLAWRERQRQALQTAAALSDQLASLPVPNGNVDELSAEVQRAQDELEAVSAKLRNATAVQAAAEARLKELREGLRRAERAAELEATILTLGDAEHEAKTSRERWHDQRSGRLSLAATIDHDTAHRETIIKNGKSATCPSCKRPYEGDWEEILAAYERDLSTNQSKLEALDQAIAELTEVCASLDEAAQRARELRAERSALGVVPDRSPLGEELAAAERAATDDAEAEKVLEVRHRELASFLPDLRSRAGMATESEGVRQRLVAQRDQAQRDADVYSEQLAGAGTNGYEVDKHEAVREQLTAAQRARHDCAGVRAQADGLELLRSRAAAQEELVEEASLKKQAVDQSVREIAVDPEVLQSAQSEWERLDAAVDDAQAALGETEQQALMDSQAVASAHERLKEARALTRRLRDERREWRWRGEVAAALSAYREDASRRARPTLEAETSLLLSKVTRGRYGSVALSDGYFLEIVDGGVAHPLRRFSGGEQDLASLCLRLALSRTLARQRGAEAGFVILDEVFGSQDADRRATLLEQLRLLVESDFRQLFVVSHTEDVTGHCDLFIRVERGADGLSTTEGPRH